MISTDQEVKTAVDIDLTFDLKHSSEFFVDYNSERIVIKISGREATTLRQLLGIIKKNAAERAQVEGSINAPRAENNGASDGKQPCSLKTDEADENPLSLLQFEFGENIVWQNFPALSVPSEAADTNTDSLANDVASDGAGLTEKIPSTTADKDGESRAVSSFSVEGTREVSEINTVGDSAYSLTGDIADSGFLEVTNSAEETPYGSDLGGPWTPVEEDEEDILVTVVN